MQKPRETLYLLGISGSLRKASSNTTLLRAAQQLLPKHVTMTLYQALGELPHFNPDVEESILPASVLEFRQAVSKADGLVISTPEYAHGVPGSLKNALDWLVGDSAFAGKPVMLLNASSRSSYAQASLVETLKTMATYVVTEACVTVELMGKPLTANEIAENLELSGKLLGAFEVFARAIRSQVTES